MSGEQARLFQLAEGLRRVHGAVDDASQVPWHSPDAPIGRPVVLAFGGNALLPDPDQPEDADEQARDFARVVHAVLPEDAGVVLVHGNGPQVGLILLRVEATRDQLPSETLDVMVAETQGSIGYQLARALRNAFSAENLQVEIATMATQVVVDADDPAFARPTKPVGPFYPPEQGRHLTEALGWDMTQVPGRGWRRVVPSPSPLDVVELHSISDAVGHGHVVIAGGGGGIPVRRTDRGELIGVEAVIDKDRTAALLAMKLGASALVILTGVPSVYTGFGTPLQEPIASITVDVARELLARGEFPPGSMGPKVEAAAAFVEATGSDALITDTSSLTEAIARRAGTWIVP